MNFKKNTDNTGLIVNLYYTRRGDNETTHSLVPHRGGGGGNANKTASVRFIASDVTALH